MNECSRCTAGISMSAASQWKLETWFDTEWCHNHRMNCMMVSWGALA